MTNVEKHQSICNKIADMLPPCEGKSVNRGTCFYQNIERHMKNYKRDAQDNATVSTLIVTRLDLLFIAYFAIEELSYRTNNDVITLQVFENILKKMTEVYKRKNADYGDSFHESFKEYGFTMTKIRIEDKIRRLNSLVVEKQESQVNDESVNDTLLDLANYCVLSIMELDTVVENKNAENG